VDVGVERQHVAVYQAILASHETCLAPCGTAGAPPGCTKMEQDSAGGTVYPWFSVPVCEDRQNYSCIFWDTCWVEFFVVRAAFFFQLGIPLGAQPASS